MGNQQASIERRKDQLIQKELLKSRRAQQNIVHALVLGAEDAGKSAFMKQARHFYGKKFTAEELATWKADVHFDVISQVLGILSGAKSLELKLDPDLCAPFQTDEFDETTPVTQAIANSIRELWEDARTQLVWRERSRCNVRDSFEYFIDDIDRIAGEEYVPTYEDILQVGISRSRVEEVDFSLLKVPFKLFNIGSLWREPRRYVAMFEGITAVVYFVALDEYDERSLYTQDKWKMDESLEIFEAVATNESLKDTGLLLILNKLDLFKKKLRDVPYRVGFGPDQRNVDFEEDETKELTMDSMASDAFVEAASKHIEKRFVEVAPRKQQVYSHATCVIDTTTIESFFQVCAHHLLRINMSKSGIVSA